MKNNLWTHLFSKDGAFWLVYYLINATPLKKCVPDKWYLTIQYRCFCGKFINWKNPKTFNEKLQWLKVYNRKPEYTMMVDKVKVKDYVAQKIGEQYVIPTLGVWIKPEDIDFDALPNQFVLKCNHDSGSICICRDKKTFDKSKAVSKLKAAMKRDMYWDGREWPYKNVEKKVFAEKFMMEAPSFCINDNANQKPEELVDYKFFCFNGKPKVLFVASDRANKVCFDYYDMNLNHLDLKQGSDNFKGEVKLPKHFEEMKKLAEELSVGIPQVRADFYEIDNKVFFGELTFFDSSGLAKFSPESWDEKLGKLIVLPPPYLGYLIVNEGYSLSLHLDSIAENDLRDYKFFCFGGVPRYCQVISDRSTDEKIDFFDMRWGRLVGLVGLNDSVQNSEQDIPCPDSFSEMKMLAAKLANNLPFSRIDFYEINHRPYFGEITFFPADALGSFRPMDWNNRMGDMITLNV